MLFKEAIAKHKCKSSQITIMRIPEKLLVVVGLWLEVKVTP